MYNEKIAETEIEELKLLFKNAFGKLSDNDIKTLEFYYKMGIVRCVDGFKYVSEAINRASMKQNLTKPISYIASLCKNFYKNGLYTQPSQEEKDVIYYIERKIGQISNDNKKLIQTAISTSGCVKVMSGAAEVLNNSKLQDMIIDEILLKVVELWDKLNKGNEE
jgi:fructose-1,6-bisphosphatase